MRRKGGRKEDSRRRLRFESRGKKDGKRDECEVSVEGSSEEKEDTGGDEQILVPAESLTSLCSVSLQ